MLKIIILQISNNILVLFVLFVKLYTSIGRHLKPSKLIFLQNNSEMLAALFLFERFPTDGQKKVTTLEYFHTSNNPFYKLFP
jgi:hypothetical protein